MVFTILNFTSISTVKAKLINSDDAAIGFNEYPIIMVTWMFWLGSHEAAGLYYWGVTGKS